MWKGYPITPHSNWTRPEIATLFDLPFTDLLSQAQTIHRVHQAANTSPRTASQYAVSAR